MGHTDEILEKSVPVAVELLAPARNADIAIAAIDHGADAVYMGAHSHGARSQAANSLDDIRRVVAYAHRFRVKVYVTVNTIVYDNETADVERLVWELYGAGVDALIVQDMGLLEMNLPPIALHASTQCDIRTPAKARFLQDAGFSQLVLPRELSLDEIREFSKAVSVPLEAFVHGALCVSYSGDCQASFVTTGRSANRGECAQICRYRFDLEDAEGHKLVRGKHLLSLKDMNRIGALGDMLEAGVRSFKIEGRLKDAAYVKNVVAAYSMALDAVIAVNPGKWRRASRGVAVHSFVPDVSKSFNRGFTSYFLRDVSPAKGALASLDSPKWIGERVGVVLSVPTSRSIKARIEVPLENGDGLGYFNSDGEFCGFRLNRIDGERLMAASDVVPQRGAVLYRNSSKKWNDIIEKDTSRRIIPVYMALRVAGGLLSLEVTDVDGTAVTAVVAVEMQPARSPQCVARRSALAKLGDTEFRLEGLVDECGDLFVPVSVLASLRRDAVDLLRREYEVTYRFDRRRTAVAGLRLPKGYSLSRHDNIANRFAARFYAEVSDAAAEDLPMACECTPTATDRRVMQTRYCVRRELGACLKTSSGRDLPSPLFLTSGNIRFRLDFDCRQCRMSVIADK